MNGKGRYQRDTVIEYEATFLAQVGCIEIAPLITYLELVLHLHAALNSAE